MRSTVLKRLSSDRSLHIQQTQTQSGCPVCNSALHWHTPSPARSPALQAVELLPLPSHARLPSQRKKGSDSTSVARPTKKKTLAQGLLACLLGSVFLAPLKGFLVMNEDEDKDQPTSIINLLPLSRIQITPHDRNAHTHTHAHTLLRSPHLFLSRRTRGRPVQSFSLQLPLRFYGYSARAARTSEAVRRENPPALKKDF
ncbi:hypothetical protein HZ326_1780 [Fusarium oxysporum f. sp. albedinis]|nr:hypothetical protein HZ326_1780 [Fusarium oxysporum f. sp. albedinis]